MTTETKCSSFELNDIETYYEDGLIKLTYETFNRTENY